jgi:hypothetical protein
MASPNARLIYFEMSIQRSVCVAIRINEITSKILIHMKNRRTRPKYFDMYEWLYTGFGLVVGLIELLQIRDYK